MVHLYLWLRTPYQLPVYVHIPDYIKQEDREVKARARVAGLLPAGTISNANAAQDECNSNNLSIKDINDYPNKSNLFN